MGSSLMAGQPLATTQRIVKKKGNSTTTKIRKPLLLS